VSPHELGRIDEALLEVGELLPVQALRAVWGIRAVGPEHGWTHRRAADNAVSADHPCRAMWHSLNVSSGNSGAPPLSHLFVYGTLQPGDVRWHFLEPFVVDEGRPDSAPGQVFDTGLGYPGAQFESTSSSAVIGRAYTLLESSIDQCLKVLDAEEGTVGGHYRRIAITTTRGVRAWAYQYGGGLKLTPIVSGNWFER
jgi:gamma-glutamylcyclotransferase (GGCT)/AIG2-like uncharacterized protein YtfP